MLSHIKARKMNQLKMNFIYVSISLLFFACQKTPDDGKHPVTNAIATVITFTESVDPIIYNEPTIIKGTVVPENQLGRLPNGYITFLINGKVICDKINVSGDSITTRAAECPIPSDTPAGEYTIVANYAGDETAYRPSTASKQITIQAEPTNLNITATANDAHYGETISFTANMTPDARGVNKSVSGNVEFFVDGKSTTSCQNIPVANNQATCQLPMFFDVGHHTISATYHPQDKNYLESKNSVENYSITAAETSIKIDGLSNNITYGQTLTVTATINGSVQNPSIPPVGTVKFTLDNNQGIPKCDAVIVSKQKASCSFDVLTTPGKHTLHVLYNSGSPNYKDSDVSQDYQENKAIPTIQVTADPTKPNYGQNIDLAATLVLSNLSKDAVSPSGNVNFVFNGANNFCQNVTVQNKIALCQNYPVTKFSNTIIANFVSNDDYYANANNSLNFTTQPCHVTTITIDYNQTCSFDSGCKFKFKCENAQIIPALLNQSKAGRTLRSTDEDTLTFYIDTEKSDQYLQTKGELPALLEIKDHIGQNISPTWYIVKQSADDKQKKFTVSCAFTDDSYVECSNFAPIGSEFTMKGMLHENNGNDEIPVEFDDVKISPLKNPSTTQQCGLFGTTYQRIFDCSMRVKDYAGFGNDDENNGFIPFVLGTSDPTQNWFLVSCPTTNDDNCSWLSPTIIEQNSSINKKNPAVDTGEYDSLNRPMSDYIGQRFLWSGRSTSLYNFFEANGKNPYNDPDPNAHFDYYPSQENEEIYPTRNVIYNPLSTLSPKITSDTDIVKNTYTAAQNTKSLCSSATSDNKIPVIPGFEYEWQMPSYPMILSITGGGKKGGFCGINEIPDKHKTIFCNPYGLRSGSKIPGFGNTDAENQGAFWSSSINTIGDEKTPDDHTIPPFIFVFSGDANAGGVDFLAPFYDQENTPITPNTYPVRCVSAKW